VTFHVLNQRNPEWTRTTRKVCGCSGMESEPGWTWKQDAANNLAMLRENRLYNESKVKRMTHTAHQGKLQNIKSTKQQQGKQNQEGRPRLLHRWKVAGPVFAGRAGTSYNNGPSTCIFSATVAKRHSQKKCGISPFRGHQES